MNIRQLSITDSKISAMLKRFEEDFRCVMRLQKCRRNLKTFWMTASCCFSRFMSALVTEIVRMQSESVGWKSSSILMVAMTLSSSGIVFAFIRHDKASTWPNSVVLRYCQLKSYPIDMVVHWCNRLADHTGNPFLSQIWKVMACGPSKVWNDAQIVSCEFFSL